MSLPMLLTAWGELVGDAIVNDAGRDVPDRVLRYQGRIPDDCCTEQGTLAVWWDFGQQTNDFPSATSAARTPPCAAAPMYTLFARYTVCWPVPEAGQEGVILLDAQWDETAAVLAGVADAVARTLMRAGCTQPRSVPVAPARLALVSALMAQTARQSFRYVSTSPIVPAGGCAGVEWQAYAMPTAGVPPS